MAGHVATLLAPAELPGYSAVPSHFHGESDAFISLVTLAGIHHLTVTTLEVRMATALAGDMGS